MRVAFDFNPVIKTKYSGFYTFGINLLQAFDRMPDDIDMRLFFQRKFSEEAAEFMAHTKSDRLHPCPTSFKLNHLKTLWKYCSMPKLEYFTGEFDVYHSFHNMMPATKGKPRIMTVHDLRRYRLPGFYNKPEQAIFSAALQNADHIVTVSESTRNDVCDIFRVSPDKVTAVPLSCDQSLVPLAPQVKAEMVKTIFQRMKTETSPYLITISATDHRKNILRTIKAFQQIKASLPGGMKLVVAGFLPKNKEELAGIQSAAAADSDILIAGPVEDLNTMIACSEGLLFVSLYEGFGIPILEAFSFDVPVLTANCSSMPEVGGNAALYCDPVNEDSIASGIMAMFGYNRQALITAGRERLSHFSWEKCAAGYLNIYRQVSGKK